MKRLVSILSLFFLPICAVHSFAQVQSNADKKEEQENIPQSSASPFTEMEGQPAFDIKGTDHDGNEISLADLKGKVVYIDVWATWCRPCIKEIPYMKELEEEFKNNPDMEFLSVSVDYPQQKQNWIKLVKDKDLQGIQIFAGEKRKEILKAYKITGIPRFMIVGKDGRLIMAKAPKPSSDEISPMLEKLLTP